MNFEWKDIGPRVPFFLKSFIKYPGMVLWHWQSNLVHLSSVGILVWIGMSLSLGLSQNRLVKMRTDISRDHTDNCDYNKTKISALPRFEKKK